MAVAVNGDVDFIPPCEHRQFNISHVAHVLEHVHRRDDTVAHVIFAVGAIGIGIDFKVGAIMGGQHAGHQIHAGMVLEICRKIPDAQAFWFDGRVGLKRQLWLWVILVSVEFGALLMAFGRILER